jgi:hypothetical protein
MTQIVTIHPNLIITSLSPNSPVITDPTGKLTALPITNGQLIIGNTGNIPAAGTILATALQTNVTVGTSSVTIGTAQNLDPSITPTFASLALTQGISKFGGAIVEFQGTNITTTNVANIFHSFSPALTQTYHAEFLAFCYCTASLASDLGLAADYKILYRISNIAGTAQLTVVNSVSSTSGLLTTVAAAVLGSVINFGYIGVTGDTLSWGLYLIIYS